MIERILTPWDFILQMSIEEQCWHAVGVSCFAFCIAAIVRESTKNPMARNIARAFGAGAFMMVASFAIHATHEVEKLSSELLVKHQKAKEIASGQMVTLTTKQGNEIKIGEDDGLRGTGSGIRRSNEQLRQRNSVREFGAAGLTASSVGNNGGNGPSYDGLDALTKLSEWARSYAGNGGNERCFEYSGEVQGESF